MPYISTEVLVGVGLLGLLMYGYQHLPKTFTSTHTGPSKSKKKNKKKAKSGETSDVQTNDDTQTTPIPVQPRPPPEKVAPRADSTPAASKPKTLAEKIAPKVRKTKVDDMLAPEDLPAKHARVMRVVDPSAPTPPAPAPVPIAPPSAPSESSTSQSNDTKVDAFSQDYTSDSDSPPEASDDGWNVVAAKPKKPVSLSLSASAAAAPSSTPLPVSTKIQRKNAKKADAKKAAKAAEEAERLRRLAMHKRDLERERINELYTAKKKGAASAGKSTATATVDQNGKLIWD